MIYGFDDDVLNIIIYDSYGYMGQDYNILY